MPSHSWSVVMITPSSERPIVDGARGAERYRWRGILRGAAEHGAEDIVGLADVLRTAPARDEREDPLGFLGRHAAVLVADVGEVAQGDLQRDRDAVEAVDGDRLLAALDLTDEFSAEPGSLAESLLAERALLAQCTKSLAEEFPDVFDGALCHRTLDLLVVSTVNIIPRISQPIEGGRRHLAARAGRRRAVEPPHARSTSTAVPLTRTG